MNGSAKLRSASGFFMNIKLHQLSVEYKSKHRARDHSPQGPVELVLACCRPRERRRATIVPPLRNTRCEYFHRQGTTSFPAVKNPGVALTKFPSSLKNAAIVARVRFPRRREK